MPPQRSAVAAYIAFTSSSTATFAADGEGGPLGAAANGLLCESEVDVGGAHLRAFAGEDDRGLAAHSPPAPVITQTLPSSLPAIVSPPSR